MKNSIVEVEKEQEARRRRLETLRYALRLRHRQKIKNAPKCPRCGQELLATDAGYFICGCGYE